MLLFVELQHLVHHKVASVAGLHQFQQPFQPGGIEKDNCIIFGRIADIEEAVKGNGVHFPIFRLFIFPMHLHDDAVGLAVAVLLAPVPVVCPDILWSLVLPDGKGNELRYMGEVAYILSGAATGDDEFSSVRLGVDGFVGLVHNRNCLLVNTYHIVGVVVERIPALVVPHLTVKHAENRVNIVAVNFIRELITKPLNVAVREITDNVAVNVIPVLIVGIEHRVPDDVFGKAVGLNLT